MKNFNLPRGYLSYSALALWQKDKDAFRRRYYENEKPFETVETIFGKNIHKQYEEDKNIKGSETRMEIELVEGLKLLGYIDSYDEDTHAIMDIKTGHLNLQGKAPWDKVKVQKHKQLVFYSLLVLLKYGTYNKITSLIWLETRFKNKKMEFDGIILEASSRELELTGKEITFKRRIFKWEIEKLKRDILLEANKISIDYTLWQRNKK